MGNGRLLNWMRCGVVSPLSFPDSSGVRYFEQAGLKAAMNTVGEVIENLN